MAISVTITPTTLDQLKHMLSLDLGPFIEPNILLSGLAGEIAQPGEGEGEQVGEPSAAPAKRGPGRPPKDKAATAPAAQPAPQAPPAPTPAPVPANDAAAAAPQAGNSVRGEIHTLMDQWVTSGGKMNPLREIVRAHGSETGALSGVPDDKLEALKGAIEMALLRL